MDLPLCVLCPVMTATIYDDSDFADDDAKFKFSQSVSPIN